MSKRNKYRSGFEKNFAKFLASKGIKFEYETLKLFWYKKVHAAFCGECKCKDIFQKKPYTPDFILPNGIVIETKGKFTPAMMKKMLAVREHNPEYDIRIVFMRNNKLKNKNYKSYSEWAEYHSFGYHVVSDAKRPSVPIKWLR